MKKLLSLMAITLLAISFGCSAGTSTGNADNTSSTSEKSGDKKPDAKKPAAIAELSLEKFNKMEFDMTLEQANEIIGTEGTETSRRNIIDKEEISYEWKGKSSSSVRANFLGNKLVSKSQTSIDSGDDKAEFTQAKYDQIKKEMSYQEVTKIIGSEGELTSQSKSDNIIEASYVWKSPKFARIYGKFKDDKLNDVYNAGMDNLDKK